MTPSLVVLTDFSALSNRTITFAAGLAVPLGAQMVLLHVCHNGLLAPDEYNSRRTRQGKRKTIDALKLLAADQPVVTEVDISEDFLPDAVKEAVRRHHPLLLLLGRPGSASSPLENVTSTAMDLLHHTSHPLLIVPTVGWESEPPRRLLLAVDGRPFRLCPHQDVLRQLLHATQGTLDVVHVTDNEQVRHSAPTVLNTIHENELVDHLAESQLHSIHEPNVMGAILQEADRQKADLLVVVARRHSLLGSLFHRSVTAQLIQESPIPVLVLPAED